MSEWLVVGLVGVAPFWAAVAAAVMRGVGALWKPEKD